MMVTSNVNMWFFTLLLLMTPDLYQSHEEKLNKQHGSDSLLLYLLNSVNKLKIQHAVDISKLEAKLQKQEEKYNTEINQLKSLCLSKQQSKTVQCPAQLPVEWRGHCYGLFHDNLTYHQAQSQCRVFGADLVWIEDSSEQHFLMATFSPRKIGIWIGCNDIAQEGRFVWFHNHRRISYSNWATREPNNKYGNEDCCMMSHPTSHHRAGQWNDAPCGYLFENFICKKKVVPE